MLNLVTARTARDYFSTPIIRCPLDIRVFLVCLRCMVCGFGSLGCTTKWTLDPSDNSSYYAPCSTFWVVRMQRSGDSEPPFLGFLSRCFREMYWQAQRHNHQHGFLQSDRRRPACRVQRGRAFMERKGGQKCRIPPRYVYIYASCIVWLFFSSLIPIHYVHAFSCSFSLPKDKSDRRSLSRLSPSPFLDLYINYLLFTIAGRSFLFLIISFWCVCLGHQFAALSIGLCIPFSWISCGWDIELLKPRALYGSRSCTAAEACVMSLSVLFWWVRLCMHMDANAGAVYVCVAAAAVRGDTPIFSLRASTPSKTDVKQISQWHINKQFAWRCIISKQKATKGDQSRLSLEWLRIAEKGIS